jgi:hypothetical protein
MRSFWTALLCSLCVLAALSEAQGDAKKARTKTATYETFYIHFNEEGGFLNKTVKELGSKEAAGLLTAACAVFLTDCSEEATSLSAATV